MSLEDFIVEESQHQLRVADLDRAFTFEMWGNDPVQAIGNVGEREFYFRSRHNEWSCEVSNINQQLPSDGQAPDGFIRKGQHSNASYMALREAIRIIDACMTE